MAFYRGQKVVCIYDGSPPSGLGPGKKWDIGEEISKGCIYTIKDIFTNTFGECFDLFEVGRTVKSQEYWGYRIGYVSYRFRPVVERKTDISIFTAMLNPSKKTERV